MSKCDGCFSEGYEQGWDEALALAGDDEVTRALNEKHKVGRSKYEAHTCEPPEEDADDE